MVADGPGVPAHKAKSIDHQVKRIQANAKSAESTQAASISKEIPVVEVKLKTIEPPSVAVPLKVENKPIQSSPPREVQKAISPAPDASLPKVSEIDREKIKKQVQSTYQSRVEMEEQLTSARVQADRDLKVVHQQIDEFAAKSGHFDTPEKAQEWANRVLKIQDEKIQAPIRDLEAKIKQFKSRENSLSAQYHQSAPTEAEVMAIEKSSNERYVQQHANNNKRLEHAKWNLDRYEQQLKEVNPETGKVKVAEGTGGIHFKTRVEVQADIKNAQFELDKDRSVDANLKRINPDFSTVTSRKPASLPSQPISKPAILEPKTENLFSKPEKELVHTTEASSPEAPAPVAESSQMDAREKAYTDRYLENHANNDKRLHDAKWNLDRYQQQLKEINPATGKVTVDDGLGGRSFKTKEEVLANLKNAQHEYSEAESIDRQKKRMTVEPKENSDYLSRDRPLIGGQTEISKSTDSAAIPDNAKHEVKLLSATTESANPKVSAATRLIEANQLPEDHPLKKMITALEKKGVRVIEIDSGAEKAVFDATYFGKSKIVNNEGKIEMKEVIALDRETLKNARSAKKLLGHETGHFETHGRPNGKFDFAKSEAASLREGTSLPFEEDGGAYSNFAAGDEARQYSKQGVNELRGVKESEIQAKFKKADRLPMKEVFGDESKERLFQAISSFKSSAKFSKLESNSYQKIIQKLNVEPLKTETILNNLQPDRFQIRVEDKSVHFVKEVSLDPKRYVGMPENANQLKALKSQREVFLEEAKKETMIKLEMSPKDLEDPEELEAFNAISNKAADQKIMDQHPWLKTFNEDLKKDFSARKLQFEKSAKKMEVAAKLVNRFQYQRDISLKEYRVLRKSVSWGISDIRAGATTVSE